MASKEAVSHPPEVVPTGRQVDVGSVVRLSQVSKNK